ncbi:MAG: hypothetical protein K940chlam7_00832 [Chlamydiae bacterium]|nr:hypothetical protein [Chlamydiota bacterium]
MNRLKRFVALVTVAATLAGSAEILNADYCYQNDNGCGYEDCRTAPYISPTIALGTVAVVAVIAVLVHNNKKSKNHPAAHSHG